MFFISRGGISFPGEGEKKEENLFFRGTLGEVHLDHGMGGGGRSSNVL